MRNGKLSEAEKKKLAKAWLLISDVMNSVGDATPEGNEVVTCCGDANGKLMKVLRWQDFPMSEKLRNEGAI